MTESVGDSTPSGSCNASSDATSANHPSVCANDPAVAEDACRFDAALNGEEPETGGSTAPAESCSEDTTPVSAEEDLPPGNDTLTTAVQVGAGFVPVVGEAMDVYTLFAPESTLLDRGLSVVSLGVNVVTGGFAPNFGGWARAARGATEVAGGVARHSDSLVDMVRAGRNMDEVIAAARGADEGLDGLIDAARYGGRLDEMLASGRLEPEEITSLRNAGQLTDDQANMAINATRRANPDAAIPDTTYQSSGGTGAWSPALNDPQPNSRYVVDGRYTYDTDELGRVERVSGELRLDAADRNSYRQQQAGGAERLTTDDGGHLVGSQFDGPGEAINLIAQNRDINRSGGQWYALESTWQAALNRGQQVSVDIQPVFSGSNIRPDAISVHYTIDGRPFSRTIPNPP
ncbi:MAG: DNA/RNA non-specific endonuclease [Candidatus Competibacteraceae bacterium]|jgi:hypothetical protein|nr:DNA/RNA non-specific endonuclease [Candidatus Competibacteraceae bacterium]